MEHKPQTTNPDVYSRDPDCLARRDYKSRRLPPHLCSEPLTTALQRCGGLQSGSRPFRASGLSTSSGQAVLIAVIFFLIISVIIIFGFAFPVLKQAKIASDLFKSKESFFLAEAGLEDTAYRIIKGYEVDTPPDQEVLTLDGQTAVTLIEDDPIGRKLTTTADWEIYFRKITTRLFVAEGVSFNYGVQVGERGLQMGNNSEVIGNIFSNGNISAGNNAEIFGTAITAGTSRISGGVIIHEDSHTDDCDGSRIINVLYVNTEDCIYGDIQPLVPFDPLPLPISDDQINVWKNQAEAGGIIDGDYTVPADETESLGLKKITGNLIVDIGATLEMTGTLWVEGDVMIKNNARVRLSPEYGELSEVIISDKLIVLENGSISEGTLEDDSYLMYIAAMDSSDQSIRIEQGNTKADIVYTNTGTIRVENNASLVEVVGLGVSLANESSISYETGLEQVEFSSGPGGGWAMINWREIE